MIQGFTVYTSSGLVVGVTDDVFRSSRCSVRVLDVFSCILSPQASGCLCRTPCFVVVFAGSRCVLSCFLCRRVGQWMR